MSFYRGIKTAIRWGKAAATLGGSERVVNAKSELISARARLQKVCEQLGEEDRGIDADRSRVSQRITQAKKLLKLCRRILGGERQHVISEDLPSPGPQWNAAPDPNGSAIPEERVLVTVLESSIGPAAAVAAWQGVQLFGTASTGISISGLSGAAASSAGWAWLGGGSLASGGGGMALGQVLLPGIGTFVSIGVISIHSHCRANRIWSEVKHLEENSALVSGRINELRAARSRLQSFEEHLSSELAELRATVLRANRRLYPLGALSVAWRWLRERVAGRRYRRTELPIVQEVEAAFSRFVREFPA